MAEYRSGRLGWSHSDFRPQGRANAPEDTHLDMLIVHMLGMKMLSEAGVDDGGGDDGDDDYDADDRNHQNWAGVEGLSGDISGLTRDFKNYC